MRLLKEIRSLMGNYHVKSGIYHYHRSEYKQAVDFFAKALRDEPSLADADRKFARYYLTETFVSMAEAAEAKNDLESAAKSYARASEVSPDYPDIHSRLGTVLERCERYDDAIREYRLALACQETYLEARVALAFCLMHAGREDEAAVEFEKALDLRTRQVRDPYEKGLVRLREGMSEEAEEFFKEAFLSSPDRFQEHYGDAVALLKGEQYEEALAELDFALSLCPKFADLHNYRGIALSELDRVEEGISAFRRSAALNPEYVEARLNLAFAHLRAGHFKEAEAQLEAVLQKDPSQTAAAIKLEELRTGRASDARRPGPRGGTR